jgi:hypothetical protein
MCRFVNFLLCCHGFFLLLERTASIFGFFFGLFGFHLRQPEVILCLFLFAFNGGVHFLEHFAKAVGEIRAKRQGSLAVVAGLTVVFLFEFSLCFAEQIIAKSGALSPKGTCR